MAKTRNRTGRRQRARSKKGRVHRPNLSRFYRHEQPAIIPGAFEFNFTVLRPGRRRLNLDNFVTDAQWSEEGSVMEGTLTLQRPDPNDPKTLPLEHGRLVRCQVRVLGGSRWAELWRMRAGIPSVQVDTGTVTMALTDDLDVLKRNQRQWNLRKSKRHKRGYKAHQVARLVARKAGLKLGRVSKGRKTLPKIVGTMSDLDVLRKAYGHERDETGRRFVIRLNRGRLEVLPYRRNNLLYLFGPQIQTALVEQEGNERPITVIEGTARLGKGDKAKKIRHVEKRRELVRRFGYQHKKKDYGHLHSRAALRRACKRDIAKGIKLKPRATFTHAGIPWIHRGEGIYLRMPAEGFRGPDSQTRNRAFVYTKAVRNSYSATEGYTTEFEVAVDDPFYKDQQARERTARSKKRRKRGHKAKAK